MGTGIPVSESVLDWVLEWVPEMGTGIDTEMSTGMGIRNGTLYRNDFPSREISTQTTSLRGSD